MTYLRASVVLATYNRKDLLCQLLECFTQQDFPGGEFEVIIVDDGSREDVTPACEAFCSRLQLVVLRQTNHGVAVARQRGVEAAQGSIIIFVDDDIMPRKDFLREHILQHEGHPNRVVLGPLLADDHIHSKPLFEQFHAYQLELRSRQFSASGTFPGRALYTGNLSLPRELFLRVGGFDPSFYVEDSELGIRLELAGAEFVFAPSTVSLHRSDHSSLAHWLRRSAMDGRDWVRIVRKHPEAIDSSPWRYVSQLSPLSRPFLAGTILWPTLALVFSRAAYAAAAVASRLGYERPAVAGTTLAYAIQYFAGVRTATGTLRNVARDYRNYIRSARSHATSSSRQQSQVVAAPSVSGSDASIGSVFSERPASGANSVPRREKDARRCA